MKHIIITMLLLMQWINLYSQNSIESVLSNIETNNTRLQAMRKIADADILLNKTGLLPANPEFEYSYLMGKPSVIGNRTDLKISQTIDFPTAYGNKSRISKNRNNQVNIDYRKNFLEVMHEARLICIDLIFANVVRSELNKRLAHSDKTATAFKSRFDAGDANILEYNKAQLNLLNIQKQLELNDINRNQLLSELERLNGNKKIEFTDTIYLKPQLDGDIDKWYTLIEGYNPELQWFKQEMEISDQQEKLSFAMSLPKISAGYMSEKVTLEQFQGFTVGVSIPLWENRNSVKSAKARTLAIESLASDNNMQFYAKMKSLYLTAFNLQNNAKDYGTQLQSFNSTEFLQKALDMGEISLIDYLFELSLYYNSIDQYLEIERETNRAMAELLRFVD